MGIILHPRQLHHRSHWQRDRLSHLGDQLTGRPLLLQAIPDLRTHLLQGAVRMSIHALRHRPTTRLQQVRHRPTKEVTDLLLRKGTATHQQRHLDLRMGHRRGQAMRSLGMTGRHLLGMDILLRLATVRQHLAMAHRLATDMTLHRHLATATHLHMQDRRRQATGILLLQARVVIRHLPWGMAAGRRHTQGTTIHRRTQDSVHRHHTWAWATGK